jgi:hypothetical protein
MKAAKMVSAVPNIPLLWRLRLILHGVRVSAFTHDDLTTVQGARHVAYRVALVGGSLVGAETAPLDARVNIRAATFVLRAFGLQVAELRADATGAVLAVDPDRAGLDVRPKAKAAGRSAGRSAAGADDGQRVVA